jgi:signal transduction histidine kinase/DNA-binding response OmpR family regulator
MRVTSILIVEDSPTQAQELRLILESGGFGVETVPSGQSGLKRLAAAPFDLVLADIVLPGIDGYELCRRVKIDPRTRDIPVVLLTVLRDPLDILRGLECGADNFLTKPYDPSFLLSRIRLVLEGRGGQPSRPDEPGMLLTFRGKGIAITSGKEQIVNLLLSAVEDSIRSREREHEVRVAKEALARSERFIRSTLDALLTRVAVLDGAGKVLAVNAAWQRSVGHSTWLGGGCEIGLNYLSVCEESATPDGKTLARGVREVLSRQLESFSMEYSSARPDCQYWFVASVCRLEDFDSARIVITHEEVTDSKRLEATLRKRAEELVQDAQRRRELQAMMAHELRNPLASILGNLHVALRGDLAAKAREQALETADRQTRHLGRLVDDLLESSRLELGKVSLQTERIDLAQLAREATDDKRREVEAAGVRLTFEGAETPIWVKGDRTRLTQVVVNLLDNAKFVESGGNISVRVTAEPDSEFAVLVVRDTGVGIAPEMLAQLFQPFRQADRSLERSRGGLGLGLYIVQELVKMHGGEVSASSEGPGRGAEFTVRMPAEREPPALSDPPAEIERSRQLLRVLIVEDNRDAADCLRVLIELLGHEVRLAHTGPTGVQAAEDWVPDIVICDIGLPGLDGYGVARQLHLNPVTARVRLVALTGYGSEEDRRRSRQAGFEVHLTKPVDPYVLQQQLRA